jgi:hypothetical protein
MTNIVSLQNMSFFTIDAEHHTYCLDCGSSVDSGFRTQAAQKRPRKLLHDLSCPAIVASLTRASVPGFL